MEKIENLMLRFHGYFFKINYKTRVILHIDCWIEVCEQRTVDHLAGNKSLCITLLDIPDCANVRIFLIAKFCHFLTAQKMKFSIKDFFRKYDQIRSFLRIWSHLLKKSLMENFVFCAV